MICKSQPNTACASKAESSLEAGSDAAARGGEPGGRGGQTSVGPSIGGRGGQRPSLFSSGFRVQGLGFRGLGFRV